MKLEVKLKQSNTYFVDRGRGPGVAWGWQNFKNTIA
jgi:hypothetical protein